MRDTPRWRWGAVVIVIVAVGIFFSLRGDERQILRRLDRLEELMSKQGAEEQLVSFGIVREVSSFFVDGFTARAEPWQGSITDRKELTGALMRYRTAATVIDAEIGNPELEIDSDLGLATLVGELNVVMDFGGRKGRERRHVRLEWVKEDGDWLLREVELLENMGEGLAW